MIHYQDETVTLHHGDALDVLRTLPDKSVDCCVTSPPYLGLRSYLSAEHESKHLEIGSDESPTEYVENLRRVFAEVRRVLTDDGTIWINLGDSFSSSPGGIQGQTGQRADRAYTAVSGGGWGDLPAKNLMLMPHRAAMALQADSWILRNAIVWSRPNAMPESVTDRLSTRYEMVFMFSKKRSYWFDLDPIREEPAGEFLSSGAKNPRYGRPGGLLPGEIRGDAADRPSSKTGTHWFKTGVPESGRNPGDVWTIPTTPFSESHFAVFPPELARRCIVAGCKPGGTVLDPFSGSGTTGMVAQKTGRKYVGIDLNAEYLDLSLRTRLANAAFDFEGMDSGKGGMA